MHNHLYIFAPFMLCGFIGVSLLLRQQGRGAPARAEVVTAGADSVSAAGNSFRPVLNSDGRLVLFVSHANNLASNDNQNPHLDLFVRDRVSGTTALLSVNTSATGGGNGDSGYASISTNGQFVLFASDASNLIPHDTNQASDIFLRDLESGTTILVSATTSGGVSSTRSGSFRPVMTPDARWIAFESRAPDLAVGAGNRREVLVRNVQNGTTLLASVGGDPGGQSYDASISHDGRRVAFVSTVRNLVLGQTNGSVVYVRDLQDSRTIVVGTNLSALVNEPITGSFRPVISADGRYVAFKAVATNRIHVFWHDLDTGTTTLVASNSHPNTYPALSTDGRWLAFENDNAVYLHDTQNGTNLLVSLNASGTGPADGASRRPVLSPDGRHVTFISTASDLLPSPVPSGTNVSLLYVRDVVGGVTRLVSVNTNSQPSVRNMEHVLPAISDDGRFVAFDTETADLVPNDRNAASDIFLRDLSLNTTALISQRVSERPPRTGVQSTGISPFSVSGNARRIAFTSYDDPRVPYDTNRAIDVFIRELDTGDLRPISQSNGMFLANASGLEPVISADGECILFVRERRTDTYDATYDLLWQRVDGGPVVQLLTNSIRYGFPAVRPAALSSNGMLAVYAYGGSTPDVRLRDIAAGTNHRLPSPTGSMNQGPLFSPNEQWVVLFGSFNTLAARIQFRPEYFTADYIPVSQIYPGRNLAALNGAFDGTGRYFGFEILNQGGAETYRFDFQTTNHVLVCTNCGQPSLDRDGNVVAVSAVRPPSTRNDIYLIDLTSGVSTLVSRNYSGTGGGNNHSSWPTISRDGRYVVYVSSASDLVLNDNNRVQDIFVYDRVQKSTILVSRNRAGTGSANAISSGPVMARDGRTVVFQSFASDLVEGDYNERRDIFVLKLGVGDSDSDGMEDDWEVAYFGDLSRDGAGDRDGDGQTDVQEFLAGTDPTNGNSILRVLTLMAVGGGGTTVIWSAAVGRSYVVQYKDSLDANWTNASQLIEADSTSMSFAHNSSAPQRFYRVIAVQ